MGARQQVAALAAALLLALSGCGGGSTEKDAEPEPQAEATATPSLSFDPAPGATDVEPDRPVKVMASNGKVTNVVVRDGEGQRIDGEFDPDTGEWTAEHRLRVSQHYKVTANALDAGGKVFEQEGTFDTVDVPEKERLYAKFVAPHPGDTVGVAHPLVVGFNRPVHDKQTVQDALHVETSRDVEGAWYWVDDQYVHFRPKNFWPADTKVTLHVDIGGLKVAEGDGQMWGGADRDLSYEIGRKQSIKVDVKAKTLKVTDETGHVIKKFPVSTGKPGWETRNGTKVVMEKLRDKKWTNEAIDAPEFYRLESSYALRMTNSGEFIHDAPWNTGNIGNANTSHGCVGMRVKDARWVYAHTIVGDPVIVTNSDKPYTNLINRYADWNISWEKWSKGNADKDYL